MWMWWMQTDRGPEGGVEVTPSSSGGDVEWLDLIEDWREAIAFDLEVVACLQVEPEPFRCPEVAGKPEGGVGADAPLAVHDLVDAPRRHADGNGDPVLGDAQGRQVVLGEDLARMDRRHCRSGHVVLPQW